MLTELAGALNTLLLAELDNPPEEHLGMPAWRWGPHQTARMAVWQAIGRLSSEWHIPSGQALSVLRAHAFAAHQDLESAAADVLAGHGPDRPSAPGAPPLTGSITMNAAGARHHLHVIDTDGPHPDRSHPNSYRQFSGRPVRTALPRGRHRDHYLVCGACGTILAWGHRPAPMPDPAPLLRCARCGSLNDPTRGTPAVS